MTGKRAVELAEQLIDSEQLAGRLEHAAILIVLVKLYKAEIGEEITEKISLPIEEKP